MTNATRTCACGAIIYHVSRGAPWPKRCDQCRKDHLRKDARERAAAKRAKDPEATRQYQRDYWQRIKDKVLDHYGRQCACCDSTTRLSIDHINGDGAEHREVLYGNARHGSGWRFYMWLIQNNFPDGYQTLCLSCNLSKGDGPRCQLNHN